MIDFSWKFTHSVIFKLHSTASEVPNINTVCSLRGHIVAPIIRRMHLQLPAICHRSCIGGWHVIQRCTKLHECFAALQSFRSPVYGFFNTVRRSGPMKLHNANKSDRSTARARAICITPRIGAAFGGFESRGRPFAECQFLFRRPPARLTRDRSQGTTVCWWLSSCQTAPAVAAFLSQPLLELRACLLGDRDQGNVLRGLKGTIYWTVGCIIGVLAIRNWII